MKQDRHKNDPHPNKGPHKLPAIKKAYQTRYNPKGDVNGNRDPIAALHLFNHAL